MITIHKRSFSEKAAITEVLYGTSQPYELESIDYAKEIYPHLVNYYLEKSADAPQEYYPDLYEDIGADDKTRAFNYIENIVLTILGPCFPDIHISAVECHTISGRVIQACKEADGLAKVLATKIKTEQLTNNSSFIKTLSFVKQCADNGNVLHINPIFDRENFHLFEAEFRKAFMKLARIAPGTELAKSVKSFLETVKLEYNEKDGEIDVPKHIRVIYPKQTNYDYDVGAYTRPVVVVEGMEFRANEAKLFNMLIKTSCSLVDGIIFNRCQFTGDMFDEAKEDVKAPITFQDCVINGTIAVGKHLLQRWAFRNTTIRGKLDFSKTLFEDGIFFNKCIITGPLNMSGASFKKRGTEKLNGDIEIEQDTSSFRIYNTMFIGKGKCDLSYIDFTLPFEIRNVSFGSPFSFALSRLLDKENRFDNITFISTDNSEYMQERSNFCKMLRDAGYNDDAKLYEIKNVEKAPMPTAEKHYTTKEAAAYLRIPGGTLRRWRTENSSTLKYHKVGKRYYYLQREMDEYKATVDGQKKEGPIGVISQEPSQMKYNKAKYY